MDEKGRTKFLGFFLSALVLVATLGMVSYQQFWGVEAKTAPSIGPKQVWLKKLSEKPGLVENKKSSVEIASNRITLTLDKEGLSHKVEAKGYHFEAEPIALIHKQNKKETFIIWKNPGTKQQNKNKDLKYRGITGGLGNLSGEKPVLEVSKNKVRLLNTLGGTLEYSVAGNIAKEKFMITGLPEPSKGDFLTIRYRISYTTSLTPYYHKKPGRRTNLNTLEACCNQTKTHKTPGTKMQKINTLVGETEIESPILFYDGEKPVFYLSLIHI